MSAGLHARAVELCRALRARGLPVGAGHSIDAVRALDAVDLAERTQVYCALRAVLASRPEEYSIFDELFAAHFDGAHRSMGSHGSQKATRRDPPRQKPPPLSLARWLDQSAPWGDDDGAPEELLAASAIDRLERKDFATFGADDLEAIERVAARLAKRLAARPGRRWKAARAGERVDLRKVARRSASIDALASVAFRDRKPRRVRLVALCDVSGSMDLYSRFLLQFLYALQSSHLRVESFVFSTALRRVTEALREPSYGRALKALSQEALGFSGGTKIGECLQAFADQYDYLLDRRTWVVILSDGWDTGAPESLAAALGAVRKRCRKLVWLNPLLGGQGYRPLAQGMQAALPFIDALAPAHDLASLRALDRHLFS